MELRFQVNKTLDKYKEFTVRDFNRFNVDEFRNLLEISKTLKCEENINAAADFFIRNIVNTLDIVASRRKFKIPNKRGEGNCMIWILS